MWLTPTADGRADVDALARSLGGAVGLGGVLSDLNRRGTTARVPAAAADYGFRWNLCDQLTRRWWPQGITTSADASDTGLVDGRRVVVVAWYAKKRDGVSKGVRLSVVDVTDPARPTYRHVLLVQPGTAEPGELGALGAPRGRSVPVAMRPVVVHAGGIVWYGPSLLVADTHGGIRVFDVADICRVGAVQAPSAVAPERPGPDEAPYGYCYVLPQRTMWRVEHDPGATPFRFSFISLDRGSGHLVAGEYGRDAQTSRLVRFALDRDVAAPAFADDGRATPVQTITDGLDGMQGATTVGGTWYVTTSRGRWRRGSLWTRQGDESLVEHPAALSVGPEDLTYWPSHDLLWTCSEWPGRRYVYALRRSRFAASASR